MLPCLTPAGGSDGLYDRNCRTGTIKVKGDELEIDGGEFSSPSFVVDERQVLCQLCVQSGGLVHAARIIGSARQDEGVDR
jgi:hypothetical protein